MPHTFRPGSSPAADARFFQPVFLFIRAPIHSPVSHPSYRCSTPAIEVQSQTSVFVPDEGVLRPSSAFSPSSRMGRESGGGETPRPGLLAVCEPPPLPPSLTDASADNERRIPVQAGRARPPFQRHSRHGRAPQPARAQGPQPRGQSHQVGTTRRPSSPGFRRMFHFCIGPGGWLVGAPCPGVFVLEAARHSLLGPSAARLRDVNRT